MANVIGVRFRNIGKVYYFNPLDFSIRMGDHVIVETARGIEYGKVVTPPHEVPNNQVVHPLKSVLRMATEEDTERERKNREREDEAYRLCQKKIREHGLDMKLIDAEYTFDNNKILFYFTADGRIDFRQLVKDLASVFKTRIELRQIGVRDETKILGGIGICGRCLCCHTYLSDFAPVSIKMAKEQNLSLNQTKISGVCGRLMCCLKNEQETYEELNKNLPGVGDYVETADGVSGIVHSVNVLRQLVKITVEENDEKELKEYSVDDLTLHVRKKKGKNQDSQEKGGEGKKERRRQEDFKPEEGKKTDRRSDDKKKERREEKKHENRDKKETGDTRGKSEEPGAEEQKSGNREKRSGRRRHGGKKGEPRENERESGQKE